MIPEIDQQTLDFDWFFTDGENIGHVASGGGKLPPSIESKTPEEIDLLFNFFKGLPEISQVHINSGLSKIIRSTADNHYLESFVSMTQKGLYSFDRTVLNNFADTRYHLVAKPCTPLKLNQLPPEILEVISLSRFGGPLDVTEMDSTLVL